MPSSASTLPRRAISTLFPYTTLFRSGQSQDNAVTNEGFAPGWMTKGIREPKQYYFRYVYADAVRALEMLARREEVDDSRLAITGGSQDRKSTRLNSSHSQTSYAVFCFNTTATCDIYTLSLHDALPIWAVAGQRGHQRGLRARLDDQGHPRAEAVLLPLRLRRRRPRPGDARAARGGGRFAPRDHRRQPRSEEHTSELQSQSNLVCRLLLQHYRDVRYLHSFPTRRSSDLGSRRTTRSPTRASRPAG